MRSQVFETDSTQDVIGHFKEAGADRFRSDPGQPVASVIGRPFVYRCQGEQTTPELGFSDEFGRLEKNNTYYLITMKD